MPENSEQNDVEGDHCPKYFKGDKVYAEDSGQTYEAIIRCSAFRSSEEKTFWEYHVHFQGWSLRHDRWLQEESIRPYCDEEARRLANISIQKGIEQKGRKGKSTQTDREKKERKNSKAGSTTPMKRRKLTVHKPTTKVPTMVEYCALPCTLQIILVDDSKKITRIGRHVSHGYDPVLTQNWTPPRLVHKIPAALSVKDILNEFAKECKHNENNPTVTGENETRRIKYGKFSKEMASLFDVMLPKYLLFTQERAQYLSLIKENEKKSNPYMNNEISCSTWYGGEFLLRMLTRLPLVFSSISSASSEILSEKAKNSNACTYTLLEQWEARYSKYNQSIGACIANLIVFLQRNAKKFFLGIYCKPSPSQWTEDERRFVENIPCNN